MAKMTLVLTKHFLGWMKCWMKDIYLVGFWARRCITNTSFVPLVYWWLDGNYYILRTGNVFGARVAQKALKCHLITGSSLAAEEQVHFGFGSPSADFIDKSPAGAATWNQPRSPLCKQPLKHLCPFRDYRHSLRAGLVRKLKDFPLDFYSSPAPKWLSLVSLYFCHRRWHSGFRSSSDWRWGRVSRSGCEGAVPSEVLAPSSGRHSHSPRSNKGNDLRESFKTEKQNHMRTQRVLLFQTSLVCMLDVPKGKETACWAFCEKQTD